MSTESTLGVKTEHAWLLKPENKKDALRQECGIHPEDFKLSTDDCSKILDFVRRGKQDSRNGTEERIQFIKDTFAKFYGQRVAYNGKHGKVISLRLKDLERMRTVRRVRNTRTTGVVEACVKYDRPIHRPGWIETEKLVRL